MAWTSVPASHAAAVWLQVYSLTGYWAKLNANLEYVKYTTPHLHYHNSVVRREWHNLISEEVNTHARTPSSRD